MSLRQQWDTRGSEPSDNNLGGVGLNIDMGVGLGKFSHSHTANSIILNVWNRLGTRLYVCCCTIHYTHFVHVIPFIKLSTILQNVYLTILHLYWDDLIVLVVYCYDYYGNTITLIPLSVYSTACLP